MRPIIFRGKRKDNGEWVEGSLIIAKNFCCILQDEEKVHPLDYPYLGNESGCIDGYATPVIPETVGQFTGELDFNGKKIFEGDIIQNKDGYVYSSQHKAVVKFEYGKFYAEGWCDFEPELFHLCEVIGKIHDNPELLEEQK